MHRETAELLNRSFGLTGMRRLRVLVSRCLTSRSILKLGCWLARRRRRALGRAPRLFCPEDARGFAVLVKLSSSQRDVLRGD
jgi:hypothetical protein